MATLRQYFETDFGNNLRLNLRLQFGSSLVEGAMFYDVNTNTSFIAFYVSGIQNDFNFYLNLIDFILPGNTKLELNGQVGLPSIKNFHGDLRFEVAEPYIMEYKLYGDPNWKSFYDLKLCGAIYIYSESNISNNEIITLQNKAKIKNFILQFRSNEYVNGRSKHEIVQAFISHDSKDKDKIARPIAKNLQAKLCTVWYDEFSLTLGSNLRESIEKGLKDCKKCVLILSKNFLNNGGWGKKEFESIFTREILEESQLVLPIWSGVTKQEIYDYSPSLLNVKGVSWEDLGENEICRQIYLAISEPIEL